MDLEQSIPERQLAPLKKVTKTNCDKYDELRKNLKEKDVVLGQELVDSEKFVELFYSVEIKTKRVETLTQEIRKSGKDPESVDEALEKTKEVIILIEEIVEIIVIIEQVVLIIRSRCKAHPTVLKEIETKTTQITVIKNKLTQILKTVRDEEKKMLALQQNNKELEQHIQDINRWLPNIEGKIVKRTPVSANFDILKEQQEENQV